MSTAISPRFSRRYFLKMSLAATVNTAALGVAGYGYGHFVEPEWVQIREINVRLPRLAAAFDGYKMVHISDLHVDDGLSREMLREVVATINTLNPDIVAITGDFVTLNAEDSTDMLHAELSQLQAYDGVVAVPGNHDYWSNIAVIRQMLAGSGIHDLSNSALTLTRGKTMLHIAGVDDIWENKHDLKRVLDILPAEGCAVLLAHEPDFADESAATGRFDLQLSGHTHGGQVNLPFVGEPILPPLGRKYPAGLYRVGTMQQYTNRGLGSPMFRVRFNCRPEITVLTLKSPNVA